jgi:hypothetical protein
MVSFILRYKLTLLAGSTFLALLALLRPQEAPRTAAPRSTPQATIPMLAAPKATTAAPVMARKPHKAPEWALRGIAKVETRSSILEDGKIIYRDRRVGALGERGVFQMRRVAFKQVSRPGERFSRVHEDPQFAMEMADRYLVYLKKRHGTWESAVAAYNTGDPQVPAGWRYVNRVKRLASA